MTVPAVHCEAKLHGFRRTQDGVVVSFVLHPAEVPRALALDPLGTRYMLAMAAIGDDERPVQNPAAQTPERPAASTPEQRGGGASLSGKERYRNSSDMEKAVARAALLPKDERFRRWISKRAGFICDEQDAAEYIRRECGIRSRAEIVTSDAAYRAFLQIETDFKIASGEMAVPR